MANSLNTNGMNLKVGIAYSEQEARTKLNSVLNKLELKSTVQIPVEIDGERFVKTIKTYQDKMKNLVEETSLYNGAGKTFSQTITKITTAEERANAEIAKQINNTKQLTTTQQQLNSTTKHSINIFQDFANTFAKMAKFNTINMIYDGITSSISEAIEITNEFNRATTELKKVSDLSGDSLSEYTEQLSEYGEAVGRTMTEMTDSATIFKRTGATDEEAAQLAQISELYKNVADSEITSAEASSFLVSQMKAFNYTADESIHVINAVNSVANHFATSTDDLQTALSKSAAAMATAGNSFEETISLVEAGTAIMQGQAGTVGNGLRTIAINVANLATKSDEFVAANGKVKISLKDENGEIKSTYQVLNDLAQSWDKLNRAEQNEIATTLAGKHKYKSLVLLAINLFNCSEYLITL